MHLHIYKYELNILLAASCISLMSLLHFGYCLNIVLMCHRNLVQKIWLNCISTKTPKVCSKLEWYEEKKNKLRDCHLKRNSCWVNVCVSLGGVQLTTVSSQEIPQLQNCSTTYTPITQTRSCKTSPLVICSVCFASGYLQAVLLFWTFNSLLSKHAPVYFCRYSPPLCSQK